METILNLGPGLGIVCVPRIGLIYTKLVTGIPAIFGHFVKNLPVFHKVLVFICIKSVHVQHVPIEECCLIGRIGPKEYNMFRCIVRYGYKDIHQENHDFENHLVMNIVEFMKRESEEENVPHNARRYDFYDRMLVFGTPLESLMKMIVSDDQEGDGHISYPNSPVDEAVVSLVLKRKKKVRFEVPVSPEIDCGTKEEFMDLVEAQDAGVAYILGQSYV